MSGEGGAPDALDEIARQGAELHGATAEGAPLDAAAPVLDDAAEAAAWAQLPAVFGSIIGMALPEVKPAYSEAACLNWGRAMVPVARKYGWKGAEVLDKFGPWPGLVFATLPMAIPTIQAVKLRKAAARAPANDASTVTVTEPGASAGVVGKGNGTGPASAANDG